MQEKYLYNTYAAQNNKDQYNIRKEKKKILWLLQIDNYLISIPK